MSLNESGWLKRGAKWSKNLVTETLKNEVYTGKTIFNQTDKQTRRPRPRADWIITRSHTAIIEEETFHDCSGSVRQSDSTEWERIAA